MQQEAAGSSSCLICRSPIIIHSSKATEVSCMLFVCAAAQTSECPWGVQLKVQGNSRLNEICIAYGHHSFP